MSEIYFGEVSDEFREWCEENYPVGPDVSNPLCFTANTTNTNVSLIGMDMGEGKQIDIWCHLQYSTNNKETWNTYSGQIIYLDSCADKKLYFRADPENPNTNGFALSNSKFQMFVINGSVAASGNIQYLITSNGKQTYLPEWCYYCLFMDCSSLTSAPELPAVILNGYCYVMMFYGCTALTAAPNLPATTLATYCYFGMFEDCSSFSECHMKTSMNGVYDTATHGNTGKTVIYDL